MIINAVLFHLKNESVHRFSTNVINNLFDTRKLTIIK